MANNICLEIERWHAWSPDCQTMAQWESWQEMEQDLTESNALPNVDMIPPMIRRRLSRLTKMSLYVAFKTLQKTAVDFVIFSSQHGELNRTVAILEDVINNEIPSPTAFSQSVHNTAVGMYSIINKDRLANTATSSGVDSLETALVIAWAKLKTGKAQKVLLVYADEPVPAPFQEFNVKPKVSCAIGFLLSLKSQASKGILIELQANNEHPKNLDTTQNSLKIIKNLLLKSSQFYTESTNALWQWNLSCQKK